MVKKVPWTLLYVFNRLSASRTRFLVPHTFSFSPFAFPSAGAIDKIVFPEGMQYVNFSYCKALTGTAELGYE